MAANKTCRCKVRGISQMAFYLNEKLSACDTCSWDRSLLIFVFCQIGYEKPDEINLEILNYLLSIPSYIGGFTGNGESAYYLCGFTIDSFLYLDPHYVQNYEAKMSLSHFETYQPKLLGRIDRHKVITSVGIGFAFNTWREFQEFWLILQQLKEKYSSNFFLCIEDFKEL